MNKRMILRILGIILLLEAAFMLLPILTAVIYRERAGMYFLYTALGAAVVGLALWKLLPKPKTTTIYAREGLVTVALSWIVLSLVGALPFTLCGDIPSYIDAVFEMVSGFTTTGASVVTDVEAMNRCCLLWRSFSNWIGGMGILVFMLAIFRLEGGQGIHLLRAESPGPTVGKMVPRMVDSSKILYLIYFALSVLQFALYLLGDMPVFDAICNTFSTAGTGGHSVRAASFGAYDTYAQVVTTIFMLLFGVNFSVYFFLLRRKIDLVRKNTELRWYILIVVGAVGLITLNILPLFESAGLALHHASFTVASIISTTGFCTENYDLWPEFSRTILAFLMIVGGSAGSTAGGLKVSRVAILFKVVGNELQTLVRPHTVKVIEVDGKPLSRDVSRSVSSYFIIYMILMLAAFLLVSLDNFDWATSISAVLTTFNNVGPGMGLVGPVGNFSVFSPLTTIVLSLAMLFGRLELYPMLVLFMPGTWTKK